MTRSPSDGARGRLAAEARLLEPLLRTLALATVAGVVLGALIGGVGGRLAMRALFLSSGPDVRGLVSDDGFTIGEFNAGATASLCLAGAFFGLVGALMYLAVRRFLIGPRWLRVLGCGGAAGVVVGAGLVHRDGVDFTRLGPAWFAIALFVAIPAVFGLVAPLAIEWADRPGGWFHRAPAVLALLPLLLWVAPPLPLLLLLIVTANRLGQQSPRLTARLRHPVPMWTARGGWLAIVALGAADLVQDARALI